jgi:BASS family bile acid:Na+ symporter
MPSAFTALFPLWAIIASLVAWQFPAVFTGFKPAIIPLLGLVMFGMGITLAPGRFMDVVRRPRIILLGVALQYLVMPLAGWSLAKLLALPVPLAVGLILVGCSPGGTASNVICYLARGDVALSITLTTVSTVCAVLLTPLLTLVYAGQSVPVPALDMLVSILRVIILPVSCGVLLNHFLTDRLQALQAVFPAISVLAIVLIIAIIVALNAAQLAALGGLLVTAVVLHNLLGLLGGYWIPRWLGVPRVQCRTLAIEVGMQNSGLAVALAVKYFSAAAALPGALFSIWHNLSGALLASVWRRTN